MRCDSLRFVSLPIGKPCTFLNSPTGALQALGCLFADFSLAIVVTCSNPAAVVALQKVDPWFVLCLRSPFFPTTAPNPFRRRNFSLTDSLALVYSLPRSRR